MTTGALKLQTADEFSSMAAERRSVRCYPLAIVVRTWMLKGALGACVQYGSDPSRCFEPNSSLTTWDAAHAACETVGMRLAVVESQEVLTFVISQLKARGQVASWVDLRWNDETNEERWPTRQILDLDNYDDGVVLPHTPGYDCRFIHSQHFLEAGACNSIYGRLCELTDGDSPQSTEPHALKVFRRVLDGVMMANLIRGNEDLDQLQSQFSLFACARRCARSQECRAFSVAEDTCTTYVFDAGSSVTSGPELVIYQRLFSA